MLKYIYFRIYNFYKLFGDDYPDVMASGVISAVQSFNIFTLVVLWADMNNIKFSISYWYIIPVGVIYIANYSIYRKSYSESYQKWSNEKELLIGLKGLLILSYIALSVYFMFEVVIDSDALRE